MDVLYYELIEQKQQVSDKTDVLIWRKGKQVLILYELVTVFRERMPQTSLGDREDRHCVWIYEPGDLPAVVYRDRVPGHE